MKQPTTDTNASPAPAITSTVPGGVVVTQAPRPEAYSEGNCESLGIDPDLWREFLRRLEVPAVEVQRGLCVARAADVDAALARWGKPLAARLPRANPPNRTGSARGEGAALAGAGLAPGGKRG